MSKGTLVKKWAGLLMILLPLFAQAESQRFDYDDSNDKPWAEIEAQLPAYPRDADLLPFDVSKSTSNKFYVDAKSISIGTDGIVHYTVVMKTAGGATNVNFEGIRCGTGEYRIYAVGQSNGSWTKARENNWRGIPRTGPNAYDKILYTDFFCPGLLIVNTSDEAVKALKHGIHPRAQ